MHQASESYLHPKLDLWRREQVPLLAKRLSRAHERPGLIGGATLLIHVHHPLVTLVRREVGPWGFSRKQSHWALARLVEGWSWWAEAHVAVTGQLLLVEVVAAVHQRAGPLVIKHVLPWKP